MGRIPKTVSAYYKELLPMHSPTFLEMRARILEILPGATEVMKYGMPTFQIDGKDICGIMAHKKHIGFYPYSGSVLSLFPELQDKYEMSAGALRVPLDKPLPKTLLKKIIKAKMRLHVEA